MAQQNPTQRATTGPEAVRQFTQGEGKEPEHTHPAVVHTHDHYHVVHQHRRGANPEWVHQASWHTHTHNHTAITHSHDYPRDQEEKHHASEAHIHDHNAPAHSHG